MTEVAAAPGERAGNGDGAGITPIHHWIGGASVAGGSGRTSPVFNPATGQQTARSIWRRWRRSIAPSRPPKAAFASWRTVSLAKRAELIFRDPRARGRSAREELAELLMAEHGKVLSDALARWRAASR